MSTEKPPSIAPKRPTGPAPERPSGSVGRVSAPTQTSAPVKPAAGAPVAPVAEAPSSGTSFGDRLKKVAGSAKDAVARPTSDKSEPPTPPAGDDGGPRRVRLSISRVDPWSVMKLSFLLSVAIGIMMVIAAVVVWNTLNEMEVFVRVNDMIKTLSGQSDYTLVLDYASFDRVVSLATMIAVVDVILLTALSTIMAFLYNIVASLVGGLHVTMTDD
ncbi:DUF3566 domain-containing protein [Actinotalea sp. M2MS4P-6]|uniref:DUF3566 domain-containing protein n=1 Tax=Actinotalea sp. M2MS4P-6 TaxID=2983762 RepID=UPI0021E4F02F|nr:DUF3566 domain-containing protein [Actinotalea sp. M2MS4P-6]MCV2392834.1 DUF3566 domain-containing protein [Actinotalea sp. M2MS4P-6]